MNIINHGIFYLAINDNTTTMDFNPQGSRYPQDLVSHSFYREVKFLEKLNSYAWCPEVVSIDEGNRRLTFKWYQNTCEDIVPSDYKEQLLQITKDLHQEQLIKPNFYKKYFYIDNSNIMRTYAFYSTSTYAEQPVNIDFYSPILNDKRKQLVDTLTNSSYLDMRILQKHAYKDYIEWPENPLPKIYEEVHE